MGRGFIALDWGGMADNVAILRLANGCVRLYFDCHKRSPEEA